MTRKTHSLHHAGTAIAAVLALASTPSLAQALPAEIPAGPAPVPEPVIMAPDIPPPIASEATVQPIETTAPEAIEAPDPAPAPPATTARTRSPATTAQPAPAPEPRISAPEPAAADAAPVAPVATIEPAAEPVAPVATSEPLRGDANADIGILALVLGGLAFLALAIWGFVAIGRRKPVRRYVAETPAAKPAVVPPAPVAGSEPIAIERLSSPSFAPQPGALPHAGAAVALPRSVPESFEEREALFKRMVEARPDRANPFTDRRMRMKRARLILQSLGRDFGDAEPWIDLSQYPNNWPELARKRSAAA
jgi:hypothetical protein